MFPNRIKLRTIFLVIWIGGVIFPFLIGLLWLKYHLPSNPKINFYFLVYGFAYTFWALFLMMLIYNNPLREIKKLSRQAEILVMEYAQEFIEGEEEPVHSLEALANYLEKIATAFRKRSLELENLVKETTSKLKIEKDVLALILKSVAEGILVISKDFRIVLINPAAQQILGAERAFLGASALSIFDRETLVDFLEKLKQAPIGVCLPLKWKTYNGSVCLLRSEGGDILGLVISFWCPKGGLEQNIKKGVPIEDLSSLTIVENPQDWRPIAYDFELFSSSMPRIADLKTPLRKLTYTVFDTETTGLDPSHGDKIVAIGAVKISKGKILKEAIFHTLVNPERDIPSHATKIHGITNEMVKKQPTLSQILPKFLNFCKDSVLVAHNAAFDLKFLQIEGKKLGIKIDFPVIDTLFISYGLFKEFDLHNLDSIARRLGIPVVGLHSALGDALLTAEIFLKLVPYLEKRGIKTLEDVFIFCRKMYSLRRLQKKF